MAVLIKAPVWFKPLACAPAQAPYKAQLEPMLVQHVLPCFGSPAGHLRAKACWVTQQYADIKFPEGRGRGATFLRLFQATLGLLSDPELPVGFQGLCSRFQSLGVSSSCISPLPGGVGEGASPGLVHAPDMGPCSAGLGALDKVARVLQGFGGSGVFRVSFWVLV